MLLVSQRCGLLVADNEDGEAKDGATQHAYVEDDDDGFAHGDTVFWWDLRRGYAKRCANCYAGAGRARHKGGRRTLSVAMRMAEETTSPLESAKATTVPTATASVM